MGSGSQDTELIKHRGVDLPFKGGGGKHSKGAIEGGNKNIALYLMNNLWNTFA